MRELRRFRADDAPACGALFHRAVHVGAAGHSTPEQRAAWAPHAEPPPEVQARSAGRLAEQNTWIAEEDGCIEGFLSLRPDGHLDLAFVAPERMGSGLAGQLDAKIGAGARALGLARLNPEASHLARPFFLSHGWQVDAEQQVASRGVPLTNFRMSKIL